jgi:hypothetical protein
VRGVQLEQLFRALPAAVANCLRDVAKERGINLYALTEIYIQIGAMESRPNEHA